ncbi:hypothetical protein CEP66_24730 [Citrobacter koseri]|nr:hypothetical protein AM351_11740 [Citrobacter koseri]AVK74057.1 hypothetical protein CEP66_24730 [Citrobacter koseri]PNN15518.1 hypothetical protein AL526_023865 [Citrobacter koseri]PNO77589.1 hypothetical protein MC77_000735 [Citrobacter koseri]
MNAMLQVTTGTNISGRAGMRQEGKRNFLPDFTRLQRKRAKCRENSRRSAAIADLSRSALQNNR